MIKQKHVENAQEFFIFLADLYRNTKIMEYLKIEKAKDDFVPLIKRTTNLALSRGGVKFFKSKILFLFEMLLDAFVWSTLKA